MIMYDMYVWLSNVQKLVLSIMDIILQNKVKWVYYFYMSKNLSQSAKMFLFFLIILLSIGDSAGKWTFNFVENLDVQKLSRHCLNRLWHILIMKHFTDSKYIVEEHSNFE